jgi:hypothetical protein
MKNHKGFALVEGLLILVIVAILAGTGWYVFRARNNSNGSLNNASAAGSSLAKPPAAPKKTVSTADATADWTAYSKSGTLFTLKYPADWVTAKNPEMCDGNLLLGANSQSVGTCASGAGGQMSISYSAGDNRSYLELGKNYKDVTTKQLTVDGVAGERQQGVISVTAGHDWQGPPNGTKVVQYLFYANGQTYVATYTQAESYPDVLSDFDLMVTKTLKFQS